MSFRNEFEQARDFLILHRADYSYAHSHFKWPHLEDFNWALDYFDPMAAQNAMTALWIVDEQGHEEKVSFEELSLRSNQVANFLRAQGIKKGDAIFLLIENDVALWELMLGAMKIGAVLVPASPLLSQQELSDRLNREPVKVIATTARHADQFDVSSHGIVSILIDAPAGGKKGWISFQESKQESTDFVHSDSDKTKGTDPLFRFFVSSNTVKPKVVEHTYVSFPVGHLSTMYWMGLRPGDIHLGISSNGWAMQDWNNFIAPWNAEATIFIFKQERFNAHSLLEAMVKYNVTTFCAPPTVWRLLVQEADLPNYEIPLREVVSTGGTLAADTISKVYRAWGLFVRDGYGQTETATVIGVPPEEKSSFGTMGKAMPGFEIVLRDAENKEADEGEICVKVKDDKFGVMANLTKGQEYYGTSDKGYMDYAGNFTFSERSDGLFRSSDYRISPFELEFVLKDYPAIREAVVIPSADPIRDNVPKALVTLRKDIEPTKELALDIMNFSRQRLSPFKRIRRVEFMEIPKNTAGEIPRAELIALEKARRGVNEKAPYEFWEEDAKIVISEAWAQELP